MRVAPDAMSLVFGDDGVEKGGSQMSIVVRFAPADTTTRQYDDVLRRLKESGEFPPDGLETQVAFGQSGEDFRVSEIWDSREQFEAYGQRLTPILVEAGIDVSGETEIFEVHNIWKR